MNDLQPGETLRVHPGHVGAFQASVSFQITTMPGIKGTPVIARSREGAFGRYPPVPLFLNHVVSPTNPAI
jgi:Mitochondrial biogenesis AIM24